MQRTKPSLFSRLVLRVALVLAGGAAVLMTAAWLYARAAADEAYDRLLQGAAIQILDSLVVEDGKIAVNLPPSAFELLGLAPRDRIFYRVIAPDGKTLTGYDDLASSTDKEHSLNSLLFETSRYRDQPVRLVQTSRAISDPSIGGWAHVLIAQTTEARQALTTELTTRALILVMIMSLLALAGTVLAVRYSLRPLDALGATLRRRDSQDLTPLAVDVPRELAPFVDSINHFMRRLDERLKLLQRFIADSAHQIRTPLTALSAQVSLIDEEALSESNRRHLSRVRDRTTELARFTTQLLNHAMVIHRFDSAQLSPLDLTDIARKAFRAAVPITIDPDTVVSFEAPDETLTILGDGLSLREAIVNIIDNSLRHGTLSKLEVRVTRRGDFGLVEVEDDGPGIPPADWSHVTQRFVSSKSGEGSSGLGFAIASEVAGALRGALSFREKTPDRGFTVVLELPLLRKENA
ncbi:histidine kinase [Rhizobium sp. Root274]|uniref:sensor histidine kinase n=1 Tax=unclassified Rhizobium TaxID=2613769 RepID=UPI0007162031|nr:MULTISPECIES: sensor histidine kinase [unclassified Rhizobium]KQW29532.1 histidine kinase [Rhizobium sp. Root1240]KRD29724.1 histidine kinase [Rhizobium sp. Root274]